MAQYQGKFLSRLELVLRRWRDQGIPAREELLRLAEELGEYGSACHYEGLWGGHPTPLLVTATVDDGWGYGVEIINRYAQAMGLRTHFLGLLQAPETIVDYCQLQAPEWLGLTVLQFDSEEILEWISSRLPDQTRLVLGGPLFKVDPELAGRIGAACVARNIADFVELIRNTYGRKDSSSQPLDRFP
jgi:hypothetical protein